MPEASGLRSTELRVIGRRAGGPLERECGDPARRRPPRSSPGTPGRTLRRSLALAALLAAPHASLPPPLAAQVRPTSLASLGGRILDARSGEAVAGASVRVVGSDGFAVTDREGSFTLYALRPGQAILQILFRGRPVEPRSVDLDAGRHTEVRITLSIPRGEAATGASEPASVLELEPLEVVVRRRAPAGKLRGFYERREIGLGTFLTGEEIRERSPLQTSDLLRSFPGVFVSRADFDRPRLRLSGGRCEVDFFLDGVPAYGLSIDDVAPDDIDGIELYRGPAEVPIAYRKATTCAAVLIWTRDPGRP